MQAWCGSERVAARRLHLEEVTSAQFPAHLSASRANDFLTCPLLFRYRSIDRLPEQPSAAALRGTLVHRALEVMFGLPSGERSLQTACDALAEAWRELAVAEPASAAVLLADAEVWVNGEVSDLDAASQEVSGRILAPARDLLQTYFSMEDPTRFDPHAMEMSFDVPLMDAFSIRGFVDRVDIAPTGEVRIIDYKTGKAPSAGFEAKSMFQMRFYALAWWRMTGQIPRMLRLMTAIAGENIAAGFAGAVFVAYLSSLSSRLHGAVQFAVFSSLTMLIGTLGRGALGEMIKTEGYVEVFVLTMWVGGIAVIACALEWIRQARLPTD